ncbi:DUF1996 domain-containing protein [Umezawaea endophytica]|uniref:DUF1996 domain-containing protein n=1 Tax=Umezawaea endophytica TaxID=1654476 RepID=A0A9X2VL09_9PSEU|nr:DUF1996 domain-containing protein [Umezawaea endophytica]MCS7478593.1 DUF1996 domain-containing protein [Umezawaea endophytica]
MLRKLSLLVAGALVAATLTTAGSAAQADELVTHHEFQTNCSVTKRAPDDPIIFPNLPGASHDHSFVGNNTVSASTTLNSLVAAGPYNTSCVNPDDLSAYWFPTVFKNNQAVLPIGKQVIYYKTGILDYRAVRPFPPGLRYVVGNSTATQEEFRTAPGAIEGWECGNSSHNWDFPANCMLGSQANIRYQAPSCWNGRDLDSADHKSHMAYPVNGACPASHPRPVPMLEFKIAFPVDGDMSTVRLASGRGYTWHYDFFNAWDAPTLDALVTHCINGGLQCDPKGYDQYKPNRGQALGNNYRLPGRP